MLSYKVEADWIKTAPFKHENISSVLYKDPWRVAKYGIENYANTQKGNVWNCLEYSLPKIRITYGYSLGLKGPQLFKILPKKLRNLHEMDANIFKKQLGSVLFGIPD